MNLTINDDGTRNIRLLIAYDGTDFSGWQRQASKPHTDETRTVQGEIEKALELIHKKKITLTGSGRTDSGVHAAGQTANFYTPIKSMEAALFVPALNRLLPGDLRILDAREAPRNFHARFDAKYRTYRYYIIPSRSAMPWELRYAWQIYRNPNLERLNRYAAFLQGEMDCTVFAVPGDKSLSRSRYIYNSIFWVEGKHLVYEISANAFLWKMVRSVVGTFIFYEKKDLPPEELWEIINSKNRSLAGPTAVPEGLFLYKIGYYS